MTDIKHVRLIEHLRVNVLCKARIYQVESVELRAAFIVRVQIQTANTIGFYITVSLTLIMLYFTIKSCLHLQFLLRF